jgi:hypothetical protein
MISCVTPVILLFINSTLNISLSYQLMTDTTQIRSDVVPIMFIGGTGGNFLASLLYHAQHNIIFNTKFSTNGNAHECAKDKIEFFGGAKCSPKLHLHHFLKIPVTDEIKYIHTHCRDPLLFLNYFDKIIKTCYTADDMNEIAISFASKWGLEAASLDNMELTIGLHKFTLARYELLANPIDNDRVLNISWRELVYDDPSIILTKLSNFTNIPYTNFSVKSLLEWRELTLINFDIYKEYL